MGEQPDPEPDDGVEKTHRPSPAGAAYPGRLDERLLTPSAPLPPGAAVRVVPTALPPFPRSTPASWAPDPTGRHQWRWWGGTAWTDHVADDGVAREDPLEPD